MYFSENSAGKDNSQLVVIALYRILGGLVEKCPLRAGRPFSSGHNLVLAHTTLLTTIAVISGMCAADGFRATTACLQLFGKYSDDVGGLALP